MIHRYRNAAGVGGNEWSIDGVPNKGAAARHNHTVLIVDQSAADHVAQCAVALPPAPGFTQARGKLAAAVVGMLPDQLANEQNVFRVDLPAAIPERCHRSVVCTCFS